MKKTRFQSMMFITLLSFWMGPYVNAQTEKQLDVFKNLKELDPTVTVRWDQKRNTPQRIAGNLSKPIEMPPEDIAFRFFNAYETLFNMTNYEQELRVVNVRKDSHEWKHVRLQQMYKSLPVEGKTLLIHINEHNEVKVVNGDYLPNIALDTSVVVSNEDAIKVARNNLNPLGKLINKPETKLVVYEFQETSYVCWKVQLLSEEPLGDFIYYVDAKFGNVVDNYNNLKNALDREIYDANNGFNLPGNLVRDEGDALANDADVDNVYESLMTVYNYYHDILGLDSFDGEGATIVATVHYGSNFNNAFWSGTEGQVVFGNGDGVRFGSFAQSLDIIAHEFTHAVTDFTSNLIYRNQSGALNESLSDIFAALVDSEDWLIGEDAFTPGIPNDALRYMDNPYLGGQPSHMNVFVETDADNGGVHINSGIPNKAAYLMAEGGRQSCVSVVGMGLENMGRIFFEAQVNWLTQHSDFRDARDATMDAARVIFPDDEAKLITVQNAWAAVGIGEPVKNWSEFVSLQVPSTIPPLQPTGVSITMRNNGPTVWLPGYKLESLSSGWTIHEMPIGQRVAPGEEVRVDFEIAALTPGDFNFRWQMAAPFCGRFGDVTPPRTVQVTNDTEDEDPAQCSEIEKALQGAEERLREWQDMLKEFPTAKPEIIKQINRVKGEIAALKQQKQRLGCP